MNRRAQAVVLLLVGGAVVKASLSGIYLRYVKEGLRPFLIAAGALLVATAVMTLWYELRPRRGVGAGHPADLAGHRAEPGHDDGHDHDHGGDEHDGDRHDDGHGHSGEPRVAWFLLAPVLALLLVAPPALGAEAASRSGTASAAPTSDFAALPAEDPVKLTLLDYASRAIFEDGQSLAQRQVRMSGFVMVTPEGETYLARMILTCCAADARPIKVGLVGELPAGLAADVWLEATGVYTSQTSTDPINGEKIPYLRVSQAHVIPAPAEQYE